MTKQAGFTLLELLITMVVGAILMAIAIPNFRITIQNNRLSSQLNTLLSGFVYARSEAIKRNVDVVICASSDQATCTGTWSSGWIVYYTPAGSYNAPGSATNPVPGPTSAEIIRQFPALSGGNTLKSDANAVNNIVAFQPSGMTLLTNDSQFTLCDVRGPKYARVVMASVTGRAQVLPAGKTSWGSTTLAITCP